MIISPPFIPAPVAHESDEAFIDRAMQGGSPGDGAFPVSGALNWHGGIHLTAPREGDAALPVRAIADGKLVYFRAPTPKSDDPKHPLNYSGAWTDNGCIVIRHETEIGEGENAQVTYFSIYMHLSKLNLAAPHLGQSIYRKDNLGEAGCIYGSEGRIHFEIIADQSQIARLVGRATPELDYQTGNGRTDSCWGDMYFFVPPEALGYAQRPANLARVANSSAVVYRRPTLPAGAAPVETVEPGRHSGIAIVAPNVDGYEWAVASLLQRGMVVRMHYEKGQCQLTSYYLTGDPIGTQAEAHDFEYDLYTTATRRYPQCPSAGYELLRFGRILGPDSLRADDSAHWRQIKVPGRAGQESPSAWFDLNGPGVTQFSDADFPHWQGWRLVDDDADSDSHCQSPYIRQQLALNSGSLPANTRDAVAIANSPEFARLNAAEQGDLSKRYKDEQELNMGRLALPETQQRLKRLICKFPTEWSASDFDTRYGWLLKVGEGGPMSQQHYDELKQHQLALAFWGSAGLEGIGSKHWHFPPKSFVSIFRRCCWLSVSEFASSIPKYMFYETSDNPVGAITSSGNVYRITRSEAENRTARYKTDLNKAIRKYLGWDKQRIAIFLAQVLLETAQWRNLGGQKRLMHEWGFGRYSSANPATEYYAAFYGRGVMQLTWAGNYKLYGEFRNLDIHSGTYVERLANSHPRITADSRHYSANPSEGGQLFVWAPRYDPDLIGERAYEACDSGGYYWVSKKFSEGRGINRVADREYSPENVGLINRLVNGGGNGYYERQAYTAYALRVLGDSVDSSREIIIVPPQPKRRVCANMERPE